MTALSTKEVALALEGFNAPVLSAPENRKGRQEPCSTCWATGVMALRLAPDEADPVRLALWGEAPGRAKPVRPGRFT